MVVGYGTSISGTPHIIIAKKHATTPGRIAHPPICVIFVLPKVSLHQRMCGGSHASRTGKIVRLHGKHLHRKGKIARRAIPTTRNWIRRVIKVWIFGGPDVFVERKYLIVGGWTTHLKILISQIEAFPQVGVKIKTWNHQLDIFYDC